MRAGLIIITSNNSRLCLIPSKKAKSGLVLVDTETEETHRFRFTKHESNFGISNIKFGEVEIIGDLYNDKVLYSLHEEIEEFIFNIEPKEEDLNDDDFNDYDSFISDIEKY